jgi:NAD(P)-dependent dehydrogenase (short-subunit alcohol dehydrogenase family)
MDQIVSREIGRATPVQSLVIGTEGPGYSTDSGYTSLYSAYISWASATMPAPKEIYPQQAFDQLFDDGSKRRRDKSIMDLVSADAKGLSKHLSQRDKLKMQEYLNSIDELEKRIEDIDAGQMAELLHINSILPALWLQALLPVLKSSPRCILTVFSARVGSISDNHKGGWYSYRASKAALNMIVRTAAIEYARRAPGIKLLAFHPGTVDTLLSRPFQKNVAAEKLFTPEFVAQQLLTICAALPLDAEASYLDWAGEPITW